jgi:hypothetical protein
MSKKRVCPVCKRDVSVVKFEKHMELHIHNKNTLKMG